MKKIGLRSLFVTMIWEDDANVDIESHIDPACRLDSFSFSLFFKHFFQIFSVFLLSYFSNRLRTRL